jgi:hypothetical protein
VQVTGKVYPERGKILEDIAYAFVWLSADKTSNYVQRHAAHVIFGELDPNKMTKKEEEALLIFERKIF